MGAGPWLRLRPKEWYRYWGQVRGTHYRHGKPNHKRELAVNYCLGKPEKMGTKESAGIHPISPQLYLHGLALGDFDLALRRAPGRGGTLACDWDRMATFYRFLKEHWKHLRMTSVVESPFAALRLRTDAAKRYKKVESATAVIWRMLMLAERRFQRLDAPEKLMRVYLGFDVEEARERIGIKRKEVLAVA